MNWEYNLHHHQRQKPETKGFKPYKQQSGIAFRLLLVIFAFFWAFQSVAIAATSTEINDSLYDYLTREKAYLSTTIDEEKAAKLPANEAGYLKNKEHLSALYTLNAARIQSLEGFLDHQLKQKNLLGQRLKSLQQLPLENAPEGIQERVARVEQKLEQSQRIIDRINENLSLAIQLKIILDGDMSELQLWKQHDVLKQQLGVIKHQKKALEASVHQQYKLNIALRTDKKAAQSSALSMQNEASQLVNNQRIALLQNQINLLGYQKKLVMAKIELLKHHDSKTLQMVVDTCRDVINQYAAMGNTLKNAQDLLASQRTLISSAADVKKAQALEKDIKLQLQELAKNTEVLEKESAGYQEEIKKIVSSRQSLSEYSIDAWPVIFHKIIGIPHQFGKYIKVLSLKVYDSYTWLDWLPKLVLWAGLILIAIAFAFLNKLLNALMIVKERTFLTGYLYDGFLTIIKRNLPYLCLLSMLWLLFLVTDIAYVHYQLLFSLVAVWFVFRVLILILRMVLLERVSDASGQDVTLYYRLKWLFVFGGWVTALMVYSHQLPMSLLMQDLFNRLFMLFILSFSLVAWKSRDVIPYLIRPMLKAKKRYFKTAISLLVILVPITLFTTAVIGLCGFINLAWAMSRYQVYVVIILVNYILLRGLLFDLLELVSEWMIRSLNNGWLWIEVFLKPLDKILRVVLLALSALFLFQLFGWNSGSPVVTGLKEFASRTIVNAEGMHITVASTIQCLIGLAVLYWASKWTKEFCYRWLYRNTKDIGIRNSLAIFTQYAVILLGGFITLRVLGLDLSGMSMILGGLAVGMGFGLRDFASNVVGGIMLLIERPVREGDLITIGEFEGQVSHIGLRSMRVSSWDNTEVLIPNAETFNKPFTNWTHQDGIVRTVFPVKVSRADDPSMIQQLILDVLAIVPEIVADPPAQVFLKKIDEALIEFEVRYFINVQEHSRVEVRSKVLFAIIAQFKAAGIRPPVEPLTVELKEGASEHAIPHKPAND